MVIIGIVDGIVEECMGSERITIVLTMHGECLMFLVMECIHQPIHSRLVD